MIRLSDKRLWFLLAALALVLALPGASLADHPFQTSEPEYITLTVSGSVTPIISSGDEYHGYTFEGLPDGIGVVPGPNGTVDVYVSHEQTTVPFFGTADFEDASVAKLTLNSNAEVIAASDAIPPGAGFLRFCSSFMAGPAEGFTNYTFFANEETNDVVDVPPGAPYGSDSAFEGNQRQGGYVVVLNAETGEYTQVAGMGRLNHENTVVVPGGWNQFAMLTTDDTFSATTSQLYMYLANHEEHIWQDKGSLWAFRVTRTDQGPVDPTDPFNGANDYLDIQPGDDWQGEFIRVPKEIARGETDLPPQEALEQWSNENNVFQFIRLEDLAYDRNNHRIVYIADTGASRVMPDPTTGRMTRGPGGTVGLADNGRVFKMEFNEKNPRKVDSFSVFADGDSSDPSVAVGFTSPDNVDTSENSLMVQEDDDNAEIWRYDFAGGFWEVVATVNDTGGESSGIVDASEWFGEGAWLLDVQAHDFPNVAEEQVDGVTLKREAGQLLLMVVDGS